MKITRMALSVCLCLSAICLLLAVGALVSLRRAVVGTEKIRADAEALIAELNTYKSDLPTASTPTAEEDLPVNVPQVSFCLRMVEDRVGVYADGRLISTLDVSVSLLPAADREALAQGIAVNSAEELVTIIQDFS